MTAPADVFRGLDVDAAPYRTPGRSIYATLAPFPIACFVATLLTDLAYLATQSYLWETFSVWLLAIGLVVAGLAIVGGIADLVRSRRVAGLGRPWPRILGEAVAFALALLNVFVHSRDGWTAVVPEGLALSALTVLVLLATLALGRPSSVRRTRGFA